MIMFIPFYGSLLLFPNLLFQERKKLPGMDKEREHLRAPFSWRDLFSIRCWKHGKQAEE